MSGTRNHHYVPQGYLRGFAKYPPAHPEKAKTFVSDLDLGRSFATNVRNVAAKRDFNRIETDEHHPNALEDAYGQFEDKVVPAIKRIERQGKFEGEDRVLVLNLIALMAIRMPRMRDAWNEFMGRVYRSVAEILTSSKNRYESTMRKVVASRTGLAEWEAVPYEEMRKFVRSGEYEIETHQNVYVRHELDALDTVLSTLLRRKWTLNIATADAGDFITSDHPVCLMNTAPLPAPWMAPGHGMPNTAILFPLTRKAALFGAFEGSDRVTPAPGLLVAATNSMIIDHADRQVYAYDDSFRYLKDGKILYGKDLCCDAGGSRKREDGEGAGVE